MSNVAAAASLTDRMRSLRCDLNCEIFTLPLGGEHREIDQLDLTKARPKHKTWATVCEWVPRGGAVNRVRFEI